MLANIGHEVATDGLLSCKPSLIDGKRSALSSLPGLLIRYFNLQTCSINSPYLTFVSIAFLLRSTFLHGVLLIMYTLSLAWCILFAICLVWFEHLFASFSCLVVTSSAERISKTGLLLDTWMIKNISFTPRLTHFSKSKGPTASSDKSLLEDMNKILNYVEGL